MSAEAVSDNVIAACWEALVNAIRLELMRLTEQNPSTDRCTLKCDPSWLSVFSPRIASMATRALTFGLYRFLVVIDLQCWQSVVFQGCPRGICNHWAAPAIRRRLHRLG